MLEKLVEEAQELLADPCLEERADVAEVLRAIDALQGYSEQEIKEARCKKAEERGGFEQRVLLEYVDEME